MAKTATLTIDGKSYTFPIVEGSEGEQGIDISNLLETTGTVTLDFGYKNTGATNQCHHLFWMETRAFFRYRGYSIEELAAKSTFLEVCIPIDLR
jgi:citrate synthase